MATNPYVNHADAIAQIDATIRNEVDPDTVSTHDVSDGLQRTNAMLDAIVVMNAVGITYMAPDVRTSASWWTTLKSAIEGAQAGDFIQCPAVRIDASGAETIALTAQNVTIRFNGAVIARSGTSPAGPIITWPSTADVTGLTVEDTAGRRYTMKNSTTAVVQGIADASIDTPTLEWTVSEMLARGGGTILFRGVLELNTTHYQTTAGAEMSLGNATASLNLIGEGIDQSTLKITNGAGLIWGSTTRFTGGRNCTPAIPGEPLRNKEFTAAAHGLQVADWVYVWSTDFNDVIEGAYNQGKWPGDAGYVEGDEIYHSPGELLKVAYVPDLNTFQTETNTVDGMSDGTATYFRKMAPAKDFYLRDFKIEMTKAASRSLVFEECRNFKLSNIAYDYDTSDPLIVATFTGPRIVNCCTFTAEGFTFGHGTLDTPDCGQLSGFCMGTVAACTGGLIQNIRSNGPFHHHFDTSALQYDDLPGGELGTFRTRIGTPKNITIADWIAIQRQRSDAAEESSTKMIATHESGYNLVFRDCIANPITGSYGYNCRARNCTYSNCHVISDSGNTFGFVSRGSGNTFQGGSVLGCWHGILFEQPDCRALGVVIKECDVGIHLSSNAQGNADRAVIDSCIFDNKQLGTLQTSAVENAHILIEDKPKQARITNNSLKRGINKAAIHTITYETGRQGDIEQCSGNAIDGYGRRSDGTHEGFYEGNAQVVSSIIPSVQASADWAAHNTTAIEAETPSRDRTNMVGLTPDYGVVPNSTDYSTAPWKAYLTLNLRNMAQAMVALSQVGGGGSSRSMLSVAQDGRWYTVIDGSIKYFPDIPNAKIGPLYHVNLEYNGSNQATLEVNGASETITVTHTGNPDGEFRIGASATGFNKWSGDCGARFEAPVGSEVWTWPE